MSYCVPIRARCKSRRRRQKTDRSQRSAHHRRTSHCCHRRRRRCCCPERRCPRSRTEFSPPSGSPGLRNSRSGFRMLNIEVSLGLRTDLPVARSGADVIFLPICHGTHERFIDGAAGYHTESRPQHRKCDCVVSAIVCDRVVDLLLRELRSPCHLTPPLARGWSLDITAYHVKPGFPR